MIFQICILVCVFFGSPLFIIYLMFIYCKEKEAKAVILFQNFKRNLPYKEKIFNNKAFFDDSCTCITFYSQISNRLWMDYDLKNNSYKLRGSFRIYDLTWQKFLELYNKELKKQHIIKQENNIDVLSLKNILSEKDILIVSKVEEQLKDFSLITPKD